MTLPCNLTHWGRVTHICVNKLTIIASDNGLSPGRRQAIIWNNDGILLIWPLATNFSEILVAIHSFSFKKMHLKMSSGKWRPFCLGLNVLNTIVTNLMTPLCLWNQVISGLDYRFWPALTRQEKAQWRFSDIWSGFILSSVYIITNLVRGVAKLKLCARKMAIFLNEWDICPT